MFLEDETQYPEVDAFDCWWIIIRTVNVWIYARSVELTTSLSRKTVDISWTGGTAWTVSDLQLLFTRSF